MLSLMGFEYRSPSTAMVNAQDTTKGQFLTQDSSSTFNGISRKFLCLPKKHRKLAPGCLWHALLRIPFCRSMVN